MRVLLVTSRHPWPPHSGDRLRALLWLEALREHRVTLVTPAGEGPGGETDAEGRPAGGEAVDGGRSGADGDAGGGAPVRIVEVGRPLPALAAAAVRAVRHRLPLHTLLAAGDWGGAIARAAVDGPFDVAVVLLSRLVPWLPPLPARRTLLDAIDSAAVGMGERARAARGPARLFWRREEAAAERLEAAAARRFDAVVAVTARESARFGARGVTLPVGIALPPPAPPAERNIDFAFWGRLPYFANRRAAEVLLDRLWPRIRARRPGATLVVAGAEAPRRLRARDGRDGVTVVSPLADRDALLARVRVALLPIGHGSGQSLKTLEAAAAGCAIAGTGRAFRGCEHLAPAALVEDDLDRLADRAVELVESGCFATAGARLRQLAAEHDSRPALLARMARLVEEGA